MLALQSLTAAPEAELADPRWKAFRSPTALEVFHSVCQKDQIWRLDLLDVHDIHEDARATFYELLERPPTADGHLLLLKGEAGSGKTHLMRAFRNHVHENRLGFCGYMQMTTATENYGRYILANLIDSLDDPYFEPEGDRSSLLTMSNLVVEAGGILSADERARLRNDELNEMELARLTADFADRFISVPGFERLDGELVRAIAYLQRNDPKINSRVLKYLRCESLNAFDRRYVPELEPRLHEHHPQETVERLGGLMAALQGQRLVLLVDQLEEMANFDDRPEMAETRFRRAMQSLCSIVGAVPGSIGVIACLEDFYDDLAKTLTKPVRDRIEQNPAPVRLDANRTAAEIEQLVSRRLTALYDAAEVKNDDPLFPFPRAFLDQLTGMRTRDVLEHCRKFRDGDTVGETDEEMPVEPSPSIDFTQQWNDHRAACQAAVPDTEEEQAELLAWAIEHCGADLKPVHDFTADRDGREAVVSGHFGTNGKKQLIAVCNRGTQGGGLAKQVQAFLGHVGDYLPVVVRSAEFPTGPKNLASKLLGDIVARGGLRVACEDSHWRHILAFQQFCQLHQSSPAFSTWRQTERPLANLKPLATILRLDQAAKSFVEPPTTSPPKPAAKSPPPLPLPSPPREPGLLRVGVANDVKKSPVTLQLREITQHAAFLGGSGSGKTTVALNLIEQLALEGVPAILVDRKGDLCGYAEDSTWTATDGSPELVERRRRLRERLEIVVYTPGEPRGNALAIPLTPTDMATLSSSDQETVAKVASVALAGMMGYKPNAQSTKARYSLLYQAVLMLGQQADVPVTVQTLAEFIGQQDPTLVNAIGWIDPKHCRKLAEDLQTAEIQFRSLLSTSANAPTLDIGQLFGLGAHARPGKTRLSILSTKFLRDMAAVEFWIAQFLVAAERWTSRHPSDRLQGVLLFDEADIYLPATRQPATKLPMESLLKRARSAGLGLFLATQSPGDFDYKCRENLRAWFLGRIKEDTALRKLKAAFDSRSDLVNRLGGQETGQFTLVRDGQPTSLRADRSVLETRQIPEDRILELAQRSRG